MVNTRFRSTHRQDNTRNDHRYQPFAQNARPPQHPNGHKLRKSFADSRDDNDGSRRLLSKREQDESGGYSSDGSASTLSGRPYRNNDPITVVTVTLKQSLKVKEMKLGREHPSVSKALHSLALEYKVQGKLNKAVRLMTEGLEIVDARLTKALLEQDNEPDIDDDDSKCSTETRVTVANASMERKIAIIKLLEEKSMFYSCLGNIYRMKKLHNQAMDYYVKSCDALVEAGYSGESKRVAMMVRIMRRTEAERTRKVPVRTNISIIQKVNLEEYM